MSEFDNIRRLNKTNNVKQTGIHFKIKFIWKKDLQIIKNFKNTFSQTTVGLISRI